MDPEQIPDIESILPPPPVEAGWTTLEIILLAVVVLVGVVLLVRLIRWMNRKSQRPPYARIAKPPREAALDVLHQLKEGHAELRAHELAARAHPAFLGYVAQRCTDGKRVVSDEAVERAESLLLECDELRFSRTPETDSRRLPLTEAMIEFVREDPFPEKTDEPASHPAAA